MLYSSEKCYKSAYECFEQSYHSLQEITNEMKDKTLEAVVLLNMGASLNHISLFERAVIFHKLAADKFGKLLLVRILSEKGHKFDWINW